MLYAIKRVSQPINVTMPRVLIEQWRKHYNTVRPHSSLRYRPPAPEVILSPRPPSPVDPIPTSSAPVPAMLH